MSSGGTRAVCHPKILFKKKKKPVPSQAGCVRLCGLVPLDHSDEVFTWRIWERQSDS